ncbi:PLP-dependent aminotransferase family protein, partial [Rothia kristinae]
EQCVLGVEGSPYGQLSCSGERLPSLHSFEPGAVLCLGSFSRVFSPGGRVGWMVAPPRVRKFLQIAGEAVTICPSVLSPRLVLGVLGAGLWEAPPRRPPALCRGGWRAGRPPRPQHPPAGTRGAAPTR